MAQHKQSGDEILETQKYFSLNIIATVKISSDTTELPYYKCGHCDKAESYVKGDSTRCEGPQGLDP